MYTENVAVVTSKNLAKSGGIQTVTQTLFKDFCPIFFLEEEKDAVNTLDNFRTIIFSGFDQTFVDLTRSLKKKGKKLAVFWHFAAASEVDVDLGEAWRSLLPLLAENTFDLFVTCKKGMDAVATQLFKMPTFFILNNAMENQFASVPKNGIGIYSGSSDYWVKNIRPNMYGAMMTGLPVDIVPFDESLQETVKVLQKTDMVTGAGRLAHEDFLKRLASREIVSYVTFCEGAPILPLEAFNNGVVCLTSDNHHYFDNDARLKELTIVPRPDDPETICQYILKARDNKAEILDRYNRWKAWYDMEQKANFEQFAKVIVSL